jgi:activator of HSP90 ATPase
MKNRTSFTVAEKFPVDAKKLYAGWLDGKTHAAFTGGQKTFIKPVIGGDFSAWDGYIFGKTQILEPFHRIVQSWRTTEFPEDAPDSILELIFNETGGETELTIHHSRLPQDQVDDYLQGWQDYYFKPMQAYFGKQVK